MRLGRSVEMDKPGRHVHLSAQSLEEWACASSLLVPVMVDHDPDQTVGWCTKVTLHRDRAYLFGELDAGLPGARSVARWVRAGVRDGLSPRVRARRGEVYYPAVGRWGEGDVVAIRELSVVWEPRIVGARWLGV